MDHGHIIFDGVRCSDCRNIFLVYGYAVDPPQYCPHCGGTNINLEPSNQTTDLFSGSDEEEGD